MDKNRCLSKLALVFTLVLALIGCQYSFFVNTEIVFPPPGEQGGPPEMALYNFALASNGATQGSTQLAGSGSYPTGGTYIIDGNDATEGHAGGTGTTFTMRWEITLSQVVPYLSAVTVRVARDRATNNMQFKVSIIEGGEETLLQDYTAMPEAAADTDLTGNWYGVSKVYVYVKKTSTTTNYGEVYTVDALGPEPLDSAVRFYNGDEVVVLTSVVPEEDTAPYALRYYDGADVWSLLLVATSCASASRFRVFLDDTTYAVNKQS